MASAKPKKPRELEPDVIAQSAASPAGGIVVRPLRGRGGELVVDVFDDLAEAARLRAVPCDGYLAAALLQRTRFVLGGRAWNGRFDFDATTRARATLRGDMACLENIAEAYRALVADPTALASAMTKIDPYFLEGQFNAL